MSHDRITLSVPAKSEYAKTVRMTAAALVSRMDMTYDDVDDVRMAAEEAFVYAVDTREGGEEVEFTFDIDGDSLEMRVCLGAGSGGGEDAEQRADLATFILDSVCDLYEFTSDETGRRTLRLVKRAGSVDAQ
jgi:serine/threonine-protein kinase RsbW